MTITFDVLNRFQENWQTAQTINDMHLQNGSFVTMETVTS